MNKRIQQLIEQATTTQGATRYNPLTHQVFDREKFAQLIVAECLMMADDFEIDVNQRGLVDRIKQHFGVIS